MKMIKAITVCQPWAWAILNGPTPTTAYKRFENRPQHREYQGPLVIHAGKSMAWMKEGLEFLRQQGVPVPTSFEFGKVLGLVDLVDCVRKEQCDGDPYASGPWCLVMANPRRLAQPVPMQGKLALWNIDPAIVGELLADGVQAAVAGETREQRIDRAIAAAGPGNLHRVSQPGLW